MNRYLLALLLLSSLLLAGCLPTRGTSGDDDDNGDDDDGAEDDDDGAGDDDDNSDDDDGAPDDDDIGPDDDDLGPDDDDGACEDNVPSSSVATATDLEAIGLPATLQDLLMCDSDYTTEYELYVDFFSVDSMEGSYLEAELLPGSTLTPSCATQTLVLMIVDSDLNTVAAGDTTDGTCPTLAAEPGAGTFYVVVFTDDATTLAQDYGLSVVRGISVCGDGAMEGAEECDDGNTEGGDGCTAECLLEDAACPVEDDISASLDGAPVSGDTTAAPDNHEPDCSSAGSPDLVYTYSQAADGAVVASTVSGNTTYDTVLYVRENCFDPTSNVVCNDDVNEAYQAEVGWMAEGGTTYYIIVDGYGGDAGAFELTLSAPVCGDGTVDTGEECDDGNTIDGDDCDGDCTLPPICDVTADQDLGVLSTSQTLTVDLDAEADDVPDVGGCAEAGPGGGDYLVRFEVSSAGTLGIDLDHNAPGDAQYALFQTAPDCDAVDVPSYGVCVDIYPATDAVLTAPVSPGEYFLLIDAYADGAGGTVTVEITAP